MRRSVVAVTKKITFRFCTVFHEINDYEVLGFTF